MFTFALLGNGREIDNVDAGTYATEAEARAAGEAALDNSYKAPWVGQKGSTMKAQRYWWVLAGDESGITLHRHAERGTAEHHYYAMRTVGGPKLIGRINRAATMNTAYRMIADARPGVRLDVCNHD